MSRDTEEDRYVVHDEMSPWSGDAERRLSGPRPAGYSELARDEPVIRIFGMPGGQDATAESPPLSSVHLK